MKRLLAILALSLAALPAFAAMPAKTTNAAYVAWMGTDGVHIAAFDIDAQLQSAAVASNRVNWQTLARLRAWVEAADNTTNKLIRLRTVVNRSMGMEDDWNPVPDWDFTKGGKYWHAPILEMRYGFRKRGLGTNVWEKLK